MKKKTVFLLLSAAFFGNFQLMAQHWDAAGNVFLDVLPKTFGSVTQNDILFKTGGLQRGTLNVAGNWGFGEFNPLAKVHIDATNLDALRVQVANSNKLLVAANGFVGISNGTNAPGTELHVFHVAGMGHGLRIQQTNTAQQWTFFSNANGELQLYHNAVFKGAFDPINGLYVASDKRLKKDFESAGTIMSKIMQLDVQKYHFIDSKPGGLKQYGMIAQDVEKIFPEVVKHTFLDDGNRDLYTMNYSALGVLAIKGIQEQQQKITTLEDRISKLEAALGAVNVSSSNNVSSGKEITGASLEQNNPNPFSQTTTIRYKIPSGANAQIIIYDALGNLVKSVQAQANGQVQINAYDLKPGPYTYNLVINGKPAASKKMLLLK